MFEILDRKDQIKLKKHFNYSGKSFYHKARGLAIARKKQLDQKIQKLLGEGVTKVEELLTEIQNQTGLAERPL